MNSRPGKPQDRPITRARLDLSRHCIQTACRRRYNQAVNAYFADPQKGEKQAEEIELLRQALEAVDFTALRRDHARLCGGYGGEVVLERTGSGLVLQFDGRVVSL